MGPVVNDWIGNLFTVSTTVTMTLVNNCGSRSKEIEADLLGLRLLAYAGWDPRLAKDFWSGGPLNRYEERLKEAGVENQVSFIGGTHPVNAARLKAVEEELARWEELGKSRTIVAS
jgi:predicted Zn-dependent protease